MATAGWTAAGELPTIRARSTSPALSTMTPEHPSSAAASEPALLASAEQILARASTRRAELGLTYAGAVTPPEAWQLMQEHRARLVDVRTAAEYHFVGRVPDTPNVEWHGGDSRPLGLFLHQLHEVAREDEPLLLLCRSGVRSHRAAEVATAAGFAHAYNVLEGFEGQIDATRQRGRVNGWRFHGLPWIQD